MNYKRAGFKGCKPEEDTMTDSKDKKDYCDADDQKKVVEKMTACDEKSSNDKERSECYAEVIKEDDGCMSS